MAKSQAKRAFITGITGQDGSYLAELLLARGMTCTGSSGGRRLSTSAGSISCTPTHTSHTVRDFRQIAFDHVGLDREKSRLMVDADVEALAASGRPSSDSVSTP